MLRLNDGAVPRGPSGLLVVFEPKGAVGPFFVMTIESTRAGAVPVPNIPFLTEVVILREGKSTPLSESVMNDGKVLVIVSPGDVEDISGLLFGGAMHFVQMVDVEVRVTVDRNVVTDSVVLVPEITVVDPEQVLSVV